METLYGIVAMFSLLWLGMIHSFVPAGPHTRTVLLAAGAIPVLILFAMAYFWGSALI